MILQKTAVAHHQVWLEIAQPAGAIVILAYLRRMSKDEAFIFILRYKNRCPKYRSLFEPYLKHRFFDLVWLRQPSAQPSTTLYSLILPWLFEVVYLPLL